MAHTAIFELADGTREEVYLRGARHRELLAQGFTPVGTHPAGDGISNRVREFLDARHPAASDGAVAGFLGDPASASRAAVDEAAWQIALTRASKASVDAVAADVQARLPLSRVGASGGVAPLDGNGLVPATHLPPPTSSGPQGPDLVAGLVAPYYMGHRGAHLLYPENSLEGLRAVGQDGFPAECDVRALSDGTIVLCHDATTGRTMTGAGANVDTLTRTQWLSRRVLPQIPNGQLAMPALWGQVLDELGGRVLLVPEIKDGKATTRDALIASITARGLHRAVIVQSFTLADVQASAASGVASMYLSNSVTDFSGLKSQGIDFLGCNTNAPASYIADAKAAGLQVVVYTVNTRAGHTSAVTSNGANGVFTDDPWHVSQRFAVRSSDPFQARAAWPHMVGYDTANTTALTGDEVTSQYVYAPPRGIRRVNSTTRTNTISLAQGWAGTRGPHVRIRWTVTFMEVASSQTRFQGMYFGALPNEDAAYADTATAGQTGYHCLVRRNGEVAIFKVDSGAAAVQLATSGVPTTPLAASTTSRSQPQRMEMDVTPTGVKFTNLTTGNTATVADTSWRGQGRVNLTTYNTDAEVQDIGVEDL